MYSAKIFNKQIEVTHRKSSYLKGENVKRKDSTRVAHRKRRTVKLDETETGRNKDK